MFGNMSPYAVACINPDEKHCTQIAHNAGCSPVWNHNFLLPLSDIVNKDSSLSIQVLSHGHVADTLLGSVSIPLLDITCSKADTVQYMACQLQRPSGRIQGLLNLSVQISDGSSPDSPTTTTDVEGCSSPSSPHRDPIQTHEESIHFKDGSEKDANEPRSTILSSGHTAMLPSTKHHQAGAVMAAPDILDSVEVEGAAVLHAYHHSQIPHLSAHPHVSAHHYTGNPDSGESQPGDSDPTGLGLGAGFPGGTLGAYILAEAGSAALCGHDGNLDGLNF
ncbi:hypothetical protein O6H91_05G033800 [Diphasiastrum complanatum]|nr:hypothetical protein O6H91_05G033800 [Diphasiastrum complanatum]